MSERQERGRSRRMRGYVSSYYLYQVHRRARTCLPLCPKPLIFSLCLLPTTTTITTTPSHLNPHPASNSSRASCTAPKPLSDRKPVLHPRALSRACLHCALATEFSLESHCHTPVLLQALLNWSCVGSLLPPSLNRGWAMRVHAAAGNIACRDRGYTVGSGRWMCGLTMGFDWHGARWSGGNRN